jgi:hypothetical protein
MHLSYSPSSILSLQEAVEFKAEIMKAEIMEQQARHNLHAPAHILITGYFASHRAA